LIFLFFSFLFFLSFFLVDSWWIIDQVEMSIIVLHTFALFMN